MRHEEPILDDSERFFWSGAEEQMWDSARATARDEYTDMPQQEFADYMYDNLGDRYLDVQNQIEQALRRHPSDMLLIADKLKDLFVEHRAAEIIDAFYKAQGWKA